MYVRQNQNQNHNQIAEAKGTGAQNIADGRSR